MTDQRLTLRAVYGEWLRVRANVRVLATSLAAAEHALRRDARRTGDREMAILLAQVSSERCALDTLGRDLDRRIADVQRDRAAIEEQQVKSIAAAARRR